ncbi:hypothetical protein ACH47X_08155 [Promicromonospora kroppenstedtii]|uniref:Restriction endonuclease n=1 Tax=Promicromonospora kroppenstedtii TaxID=440482 RepID=A0ABW7XH83_9MICO
MHQIQRLGAHRGIARGKRQTAARRPARIESSSGRARKLMPEPGNGERRPWPPGAVFEFLVRQTLPHLLGGDAIDLTDTIGDDGVDISIRDTDGRVSLIEVKYPTPSTGARLDHVKRHLSAAAKNYARQNLDAPRPRLILVVPGTLSNDHTEYLRESGIEVVDGPALRTVEAPVPNMAWPDWIEQSHRPETASFESGVAAGLAEIAPGRTHWSRYQRFVTDTLSRALCPPLDTPLTEFSNTSGINRRDIIFRNYAESGFWSFLRNHYEAHYIVVDAKNYQDGIEKNDVLQVANYLSPHGAGLFGMIVTREGQKQSSELTRMEQWVGHRKMILVLTDSDLIQMANLAEGPESASDLIRQKIEDFRLGF